MTGNSNVKAVKFQWNLCKNVILEPFLEPREGEYFLGSKNARFPRNTHFKFFQMREWYYFVTLSAKIT